MTIDEIIIRIALQILEVSHAILNTWVDVPQNATGPMDTNITLTTAGTTLVENIASAANGIVEQINHMLI